MNLMKLVPVVALALAFTAACSFGGSSDSYENEVTLECNDQVLLDRTFTSREECEEFAEENQFDCNGIELTISC